MANEDRVELTVQDWTEINKQVQYVINGVEEMKTNHLPHLEAAVEKVNSRVELLSDKFDGRPSWAVMWIITSLTTAATMSTTLLIRAMIIGH